MTAYSGGVVVGARFPMQKEAISEALWRVMSRGGPQDLTLRAVASEAGCTTGLVTRVFPNKKALLLHARRMLHERTAVRMRQTVRDEPDAHAALLTVALDASLGPEFDARIWLGYIAATLSDDELRASQVEANRDFIEVVESLVGRIRPDWTEQRRSDKAIEIVVLVSGQAVLRSTDPEIYSSSVVERLVRSTVESLA